MAWVGRRYDNAAHGVTDAGSAPTPGCVLAAGDWEAPTKQNTKYSEQNMSFEWRKGLTIRNLCMDLRLFCLLGEKLLY